MRNDRKRFGILVVAMALLGCGGSLNSNKGPDGSTTGACSTLGACECMAASDRCVARTESCWCPSECDPNIACICGGGRFLGCEDNVPVASCTSALAAVNTKCGVVAQYVGEVCSTSANPSCVAACLVNLNSTGSCDELACTCPVCDCIGPVPNPFLNCLSTCNPPPPPPEI